MRTLSTPRNRLTTLLCVAALVAAACGSDDDSQAASGAPDQQTAEATDTEVSAPTDVDTATSEPAAVEASEDSAASETAACDAASAGANDYTMDVAGTVYSVRTFVPSAATTGAELPIVLNWHGLGSDGPQQALFTGYETLAESEGFVVVSPTGPPAPGDTRNSWELIQLDTPNRDDVAFASAVIDDVIERFCGDAERVYSTGMSNGGLFTSRLVCELSERIAAAASVAGVTHPDECSPSRAVPFIAFHGTADAVVPYDGTTGSSSLLVPGADQSVVDFFSQVMPDEFAQFAADAGCAVEPQVAEVSAEVTTYSYNDCTDGVPMTFYEVVEGGHTWPNSPFAEVLTASGLGYTTLDVDATVDSWAFFSQHTLSGS